MQLDDFFGFSLAFDIINVSDEQLFVIRAIGLVVRMWDVVSDVK